MREKIEPITDAKINQAKDWIHDGCPTFSDGEKAVRILRDYALASFARIEADKIKIAELRTELEAVKAENTALIELARAVSEHFMCDDNPMGVEARAILAKHDARGKAKAEQGKELES